MTAHQTDTRTIIRGRIYGARLGDLGEKFYLAVSNNQRNRALDSFLAVRLTTTPKPNLDTIVELGPHDAPWAGRVVCDDVEGIYHDEVTRDAGAIHADTMRRVEDGLRAALGL